MPRRSKRKQNRKKRNYKANSGKGNQKYNWAIFSLNAAMVDKITSAIEADDQVLQNNIKSPSFSLSQNQMNIHQESRKNLSVSKMHNTLYEVNSVKEISTPDKRKEMNETSEVNMFQHPAESKNNHSKLEKLYENTSQQLMSRLSDEAPELGITCKAPRRLNSTSNLLGNCSTNSDCGSTAFVSEIDAFQKSAVQIFENKQYSENSFKDFSCFEESKEENKMYMETTKNDKHVLNSSLLCEDPRNRSTPILKIGRTSYRKLSSPDISIVKNLESVVSSSNDLSTEEYHSCYKDWFKGGNVLDEDESQFDGSCFISCGEATSRSAELLSSRKASRVIRTCSRDTSIQCDLRQKHLEITEPQVASCDSSCTDENVNARSAHDEFLSFRDSKSAECELNVSSTTQDFFQYDNHNFRAFKRLFTKVSVHKFLHVLSVLPLEKLLEFICLTFSIPLVETMAISISVTKAMNVLSTFASFSNLNHQLKNYGSKAIDFFKCGMEDVLDRVAKFNKKADLATESCACHCDVQKITDLEKRLKNLENELTKFQLVDNEIEKLKEIATIFQNAAFKTSETNKSTESHSNAPSIPPPPPPPPPPLPAFTSFATPLIICKKNSSKPQDSLSRLSITVEDLQKVVLRKVATTEKQTNDNRKGPVVSLEMLRSVKLRSSARKRTQVSPTRTPTSRDRIRRIKSPHHFRSSSRSTERNSRFASMPLSKILNMDDSFQFMDCRKTTEARET